MMRYGIDLIAYLCDAFGPSGCETEVALRIREQLDNAYDDLTEDRLGNLIAHLAPADEKKRPRVMISAHMDEVGFMVTGMTEEGYLKFDTLGGIDPRVLSGKAVLMGDEENRVRGVISAKAVHHKSPDERLTLPTLSSLLIDIGASSREDAEKYLSVGSFGTFLSPFYRFGKDNAYLKGKALDDRLGCAMLIELLRELVKDRPDGLPDLYVCFTVREEVGLSGAQVAAQAIRPDYAVVIETTAVADVAGVPPRSTVAKLGMGGALSLADRSTIYDAKLIEKAQRIAEENGIPLQIKQAVSGGNDASHIHKSGVGVKTLALSAPTRYLHSPASVANENDYASMLSLLRAILHGDVFA